MSNHDIWIDIKTIAEIKQITPRALRLALKRDKYTFREVKIQKKKSYEILLSSLEPNVQDIYMNTYYREVIETVNHELLLPMEKPVQTKSGFIPEQARTIALARLDLIQDWIKFRDKAFKAKYFSKSTDFTEAGFNGIYTNLGIKPVYAKPYNARAKVIERFFREFQEEFEKLLPTYTGSNIANKPAHLKRNEKLHKKLYEKINQGYIPTVEENIAPLPAHLFAQRLFLSFLGSPVGSGIHPFKQVLKHP